MTLRQRIKRILYTTAGQGGTDPAYRGCNIDTHYGSRAATVTFTGDNAPATAARFALAAAGTAGLEVYEVASESDTDYEVVVRTSHERGHGG
jgi:hypothetical protein